MQQITRLLKAARKGDQGAANGVLEVAYPELRSLAASTLRGQRPDHTLQPTSLVGEAVVRILLANALATTESRTAFFALAARAMKSVLIDYARRRGASKRPTGNNRRACSWDESISRFEEYEQVDLVSLGEAMHQLEARSKRQHDTVLLRFFGGLSNSEIAEYLNVSLSTVEKDWHFARAWLRKTLDES